MARILVIDDELFYREHVSDVLGKAGHDVVKAQGGKEGVNLFGQDETIEAVLCDVVMPGFDGMAVLSKIRQKNDSVPVIMLSAHEEHRMVLQAMRRGAFDYQRKPISPQELVLAVDRALEYSRLQVEKVSKLERLATLENGAQRLSQMVTDGGIPLEALAQEYELLESAVGMVSELLQCDRVSIMMLDPEDGTLKVAVSVGLSKSHISQEAKPAKESVSSYVLKTGQGILVSNAEEDKRVPESAFSSQYKTQSFVVAPVKIGEKIVGTINANDKKNGSEFNEDDLFLLRTMSHHVSASLSHAIQTSEMKRDRQRLQRLTEFQRVLIHYLEPEQMMCDLLQKVQDLMNTVNVAIFLQDDEGGDLVLKMGFNGKKEMSKKIVIRYGESITGLAAKEGKLFMINSPEKDRRFIMEAEWPGKGVIRSMLVAPIRLSGQTIGAIRLLNKRSGPFNQDDAQLLKDVADPLSIAIRNMKLYEQLNKSVEDIIEANRNLEKANDELAMKAKELEVLEKVVRGGVK